MRILQQVFCTAMVARCLHPVHLAHSERLQNTENFRTTIVNLHAAPTCDRGRQGARLLVTITFSRCLRERGCPTIFAHRAEKQDKIKEKSSTAADGRIYHGQFTAWVVISAMAVAMGLHRLDILYFNAQTESASVDFVAA